MPDGLAALQQANVTHMAYDASINGTATNGRKGDSRSYNFNYAVYYPRR
jgi:hypothetical protein